MYFISMYRYRIVGDGSATDVEGGTATSSNFNNSTKNAQHQSKKLKTNNYFTPSTLNNLETVETIDSTSSILDIHVSDLCKEGTPQIYTLCGRGSRSSLRVLRYGLPVDDFTRGAALPGIPTKIFSLKKLINDEYDSFIVVCFTDSTLVLSVGDDVKEVKDSGFDTNKQTLHIVTLSNNAGHAQVHPEGILMVLPNNEKTEWKAPLGKRVIAVSANSKQIVVGLEGGTIVYFEMGPNHQMLNSGTYEVGSEITCVDLGEIPDGRVQSSFLSIGSTDQCIRLLSLSPDRLLDQLSMQIVPSIPHSICLVELNGRVTSSKSTSSNSSIHLCIGLKTGVLMRKFFENVV
jgi:splicing factor 3B subunit 3